jgi:putative aldouronate transport system substrate-binding protein
MMKRLKIAAAFVLAASLLVSCSGKKDDVSAAAGSSDYYNENFAEKVSLTWYGGANAPIDDNSWGELEMERLFNLDLSVVRAEEEGLAALFASGNIPDYIAETAFSNMAAMNSMGVIGEIPLEKIQEFMPEQYALGLSLDPNVFSYNMINGKNMAIPRFAYVASTNAPVIRADWLKAVGKAVPKTLEEYEDVMLAFRNNDPDGNGRKDTYGMTGFNDPGAVYPRLFSSTFGAYGINPFYWKANNNGEVEFGFTTDEFLAALKTLRRWYELELIDPEFITTAVRTSGEDIAYKFANGRIGIMESYNYEDYQVDNDGHVSAKWTTAHEGWRAFFESNAGNAEVLYQYDVPTDFVDDFPLQPYYIAINPPIGPEGKSGAFKDSVIGARLHVGVQVEKDPTKLERILRLLEVMVVDPKVKINMMGPEAHGQWMTLEDGTIINNPNMRDNPMYHPQGILDGSGWFFWPMWFNDKLGVELIGGPRNEQRYSRLLPIFQNKPSINNDVPAVLASANDYNDLLGEYVAGYITQAIRGDVDIDATYPKMKADWFSRGGTKLTEEANEWYKGTR